jgi:hypothetical protein
VSSLIDARAKLKALLLPQVDTDPDVHDAPVDAVVTPALIIGWRVPMLDHFANCTAQANLFVMIVAERLEMASGYETIEDQYQRIEQTLRAAGWAIDGDSGPGAAEIGKTLYLACRVDVRVPITL